MLYTYTIEQAVTNEGFDLLIKPALGRAQSAQLLGNLFGSKEAWFDVATSDPESLEFGTKVSVAAEALERRQLDTEAVVSQAHDYLRGNGHGVEVVPTIQKGFVFMSLGEAATEAALENNTQREFLPLRALALY